MVGNPPPKTLNDAMGSVEVKPTNTWAAANTELSLSIYVVPSLNWTDGSVHKTNTYSACPIRWAEAPKRTASATFKA
jgi:hypothetical protein